MFRSKRLLEAIRECPCANCGAEDGTAVYNHNEVKGESYDWNDFWSTYCFRLRWAF
jgi:hypothetical protein